jgi:hypothetical protein
MHRSHAPSASIGALQIIRVRALHSRSCRRHVGIARYPGYAQTSMYRVVEARELPFGIAAGLGCKWHPADHLRRRANPSRLCEEYPKPRSALQAGRLAAELDPLQSICSNLCSPPNALQSFRKSSVPISECVLSRCVMSGRPHRSTEKPGTGNSSGHRRRATQVDGKGRLVHSRF